MPCPVPSFARFARLPFVAIALALALRPTASQAWDDPSTPSSDRRPNIVWLISEDNSKHFLRLFDEGGAETPRIAELAAHGVVFERAFSNAPVCSVARTTLMTSCYAPRIGTQFHRRERPVPLPDGLHMFPWYLRQAGYRTTNRDKKDYNAVEGDGVWDESSRRASWRGRTPGQPFFHMQTFTASHEGSLHFTAEEMARQETETDPASITVSPHHPDTPTFRYTYARYHDRVRLVDRQIGEVVDELAEDGLLEDTFIFYFGDHGGVLPGSKGYANQRGLHVPLVVRIPEKWRDLAPLAPGSRTTGFVSFIDFGPTVLRLAGIDPPDGIDGRAFLGGRVTKAELAERDETFGYADRFDEKYDFVRTLRQGRFVYTRRYTPFLPDGLENEYRYRMLAWSEWRRLFREGKLAEAQRRFFEPGAPEELYDIEQDPHETRDLARDPAHAAELRRLRARLGDIVRSLPDLSVYPESVLVRDAFDDPREFSRMHRQDIARLFDILDLALVPFEEARTRIEAALSSGNPWERYHAIGAAIVHGTENLAAAAVVADRVREIAAGDPELLVRGRAAAFLGLTKTGDPRPILLDALAASGSPIEVLILLNGVILLRDGTPGHEFDFDASRLRPGPREHQEVQRRIRSLGA